MVLRPYDCFEAIKEIIKISSVREVPAGMLIEAIKSGGISEDNRVAVVLFNEMEQKPECVESLIPAEFVNEISKQLASSEEGDLKRYIFEYIDLNIKYDGVAVIECTHSPENNGLHLWTFSINCDNGYSYTLYVEKQE